MKADACHIALVVLAVFTGTPAMAIVVVFENFEDDPVVNKPFTQPGLTGPPTNAGLPGTWIPNQYVVPDPWFDEMDGDPDTNHQLQVVGELVPGASNEAFFQQRHTLCPRFMQCGQNPMKPGEYPDGVDLGLTEEGIRHFWATSEKGNYNGDCEDLGLTEPGPCASDQFSRDGFLQFSLADGTPRPAAVGDVLKVAMDLRVYEGIAAFALTNDIQKMAADTANHPELTKNMVGFGQPQHPIDEGLSRENLHPNVVALLTEGAAKNGFHTDAWLPGDNRVELDPDLNIPIGQNCPGSCLLSGDDDAPVEFMNHLEFTYTVGNDTFDEMFLTYVAQPSGDVLTEEVRQEEVDVTNGVPRCTDPLCGLDKPVPISQPQILDPEQNPDGPNHIDGFVFSNSRNNSMHPHYRIDNICIVINGELGECEAGPAPLSGDANNDGLVTGADLIAVQQNFGNTGLANGLLEGDANDDGLVTGADLISVQQNFGKAAAVPVPEPATAASLFVLVGLIGRRRTRR